MTTNEIVKKVLLGPPIAGIFVNRNGGGYKVQISFCPDWITESQLIHAFMSEGFYKTEKNHTYKCTCWREETVNRKRCPSMHTPWSATVNLQ